MCDGCTMIRDLDLCRDEDVIPTYDPETGKIDGKAVAVHELWIRSMIALGWRRS